MFSSDHILQKYRELNERISFTKPPKKIKKDEEPIAYYVPEEHKIYFRRNRGSLSKRSDTGERKDGGV